MNRQERLAVKYKGQLRCENCNKFTPVTMEKWKFFKDKPDLIFYCERYLCKRSRPEALLYQGK